MAAKHALCDRAWLFAQIGSTCVGHGLKLLNLDASALDEFRKRLGFFPRRSKYVVASERSKPSERLSAILPQILIVSASEPGSMASKFGGPIPDIPAGLEALPIRLLVRSRLQFVARSDLAEVRQAILHPRRKSKKYEKSMKNLCARLRMTIDERSCFSSIIFVRMLPHVS